MGCPPQEVVALKLWPTSRPQVLYASKADDSCNGGDVGDDNPMLEVTPSFKVTQVLTRRAKKKIDVISKTWVL